MHIEPGIVSGAKMALAIATAAGVGTLTVKSVFESLKSEPWVGFAFRALLAMTLVFTFFEILPHYPVGISEVHFIFATLLFLLLGLAPAAIGLSLGLLGQGLLFAPSDLPMYFVNVTTLLAPLFAVSLIARRFIPEGRAFVDLKYVDVLRLSAMYQGGVIAWVAFWALYGQGFTVSTLNLVGTFAVSYLVVIIVEPFVDLGLLAIAKKLRSTSFAGLLNQRLFTAA